MIPEFPHAPQPGFWQFLYWDRPASPGWEVNFNHRITGGLESAKAIANEEALWLFCRQFALRDDKGNVYGPFRPFDALGRPAPESWFKETML